MNQEFVIYTGIQDTVIVRNPQLTKVYRLDRGQGIAVVNESDKRILLEYREMTGCCGNRREQKAVYTDEEWCRWQNFNLSDMRRQWTSKMTN